MSKKLIRSTVFSKTPLKSVYKFEDNFQIFPFGFPGLPKSKTVDNIPLIIEYWLDESEYPKFEGSWTELISLQHTAGISNKNTQLTRLLCVISNHRIFPSQQSGIIWGMEMPEEITDDNRDECNSRSSRPIAQLFFYPALGDDMTQNVGGFTESRWPTMKRIRHSDYYMINPIDSKEKEITLPNTCDLILSKYFGAKDNIKSLADTVCHLICNGLDLMYTMRSLSFLAVVSAIETLVDFEYAEINSKIKYECRSCKRIVESPFKCDTCKNPTWGISSKFREFLLKYVSDAPEWRAKYNKIYSIRSKITHTGALLLGDQMHTWDDNPVQKKDYASHIEAVQLARLALVNWLLKSSKV